jgi:hypothetical protein
MAQAAVWLRELRVSQHFSTFYRSSVQAMDTQLGARHRRWTPTIHRAAQGRGRPRKPGGGNPTSGVGPEGGEPLRPCWVVTALNEFRIPNHTPRKGRTGRYRATRGPAFFNEQPLPVAGSGSGREALAEPAQPIRWARQHASTATLQHASLGLAPLIHGPRSDRMFVASDHGRDIMHASTVELAESGQGR